MKNIHVLPTDKPSRLFYNVGGALLFTNYENHNGVNIYITSDEEIKEGEYQLYNPLGNFDNAKVSKAERLLQNDGRRKKIILTTDQDLIKDGVQAIDDEFLEWFVKNPSCEEVDVKNPLIANVSDFCYKIIIPKEEAKQICNNCKIEISKYGCACGGKPKQETLEEVGMYQQELFNYLHDLGVTALQSEMQEIERIVLGMQNINALHFEIDALKREIKLLKNQKEKDKEMYSEEDIIEILIEYNYLSVNEGKLNSIGTIKKWFEKLKNK